MTMRSLLLAALLCPYFAIAQSGASLPDADRIQWTITSAKADPGSYDLLFRGELTSPFVIYSQQEYPDLLAAPLPTWFRFDTVPGVEVMPTVAETGKEVVEHEDPWYENAKIKKFKGWVAFTASIKSSLPAPVITGSLDYQTCDDQACTPGGLFFRAYLAENRVEVATVSFTDSALTSAPVLASSS